MDFLPFQWVNRLDIAALALCGVLLGLLRSSYNKKRRAQIPFPPGPKGLPILGNTLDMPLRDDHLTITRWGQQYGDVVLVSLLDGQDVVYLNTPKAVNDLLEKRSRIYSDRPRLPLYAKSAGAGWNFGLTPYGDDWRFHRKVFVSRFGIQKAKNYAGVQEDMMKLFLRQLLPSPEKLLDHIEVYSNRVIMKVVYDIHVESREDEFVGNLHAAMQLLSEATRPIAYLIESLPLVNQLSFLWPGALGKRGVGDMRRVTDQLTSAPFVAAKACIELGENEPSYVSELLGQLELSTTDSPLNEKIISNTAAVAFVAGAETTAASSTAFILAMVLYPEVQRRAQAEIERVIGGNRLPTVEDKGNLPYVFAVFLETLRWHTVTPQGVPHRLQVDDIYDGYLLPAGATVVSNTWGILHDPNTYEDPTTFKPERHLLPNGTVDLSSDPRKYAFGFGRRVCAGMHFGENSVWIFIARVLATMTVSHKIDEQGKKIDVRLEPISGLISRPVPFECAIAPRSKQALDLVMKD